LQENISAGSNMGNLSLKKRKHL